MFLFLLVMLKLLGLLLRSEHQDSERPQDRRKSEANIISSESNNCPHGFEGRSGK